MQPRCSRGAAEVQLRSSRDAAEMQPRCSRGAASPDYHEGATLRHVVLSDVDKLEARIAPFPMSFVLDSE